MKKRRNFTLFFGIVFFLGLIVLAPRKALAENCPIPPCSSAYSPSYCSISTCSECSSCHPKDPAEDITGKVVNPIFSDRLKKMPGDVFLNNFLRTGISFLLLIGSVIFFFVLLSGGIKWLSSSGDKAKLESAQKQISSSLVGLAILLSTFVIMKVIETLFGISLLQFTLPTL